MCGLMRGERLVRIMRVPALSDWPRAWANSWVAMTDTVMQHPDTGS
jgi:hypothetical protein